MNATATNAAPSAPVQFIRKPGEWVTPAQLRALLKSNLGLNARQVTVAKSHSSQYLDITIRDASVDVAAVEAFAKSFATWTMDETDYVSGQSVSVKTTEAVDDSHAAPFMTAAAKVAEYAETMGEAACASFNDVLPGLFVNKDRGEIWLSRGNARRPYRRGYELRQDWAIRALALDMATLQRKA